MGSHSSPDSRKLSLLICIVQFIRKLDISLNKGQMFGARDPHYIEFVARLRNERKSQDLSQGELGKRLNRNQAFVSKVETCERRIDAIEAAAWCIALGIRLEDAMPPDLQAALDRASRGGSRGQDCGSGTR